MSSKRMMQVAEQIREHIALMFARGEIADPRVRGVTVNSVSVTADLQTARVYYSVYGDESTKSAAKRGLSQASGFIRKSLAGSLKLRYTPAVIFYFDESVERAGRINELINNIRRQDAEQAPSEETPATESSSASQKD